MAEPASWLLIEELLERSDPAFVAESIHLQDVGGRYQLNAMWRRRPARWENRQVEKKDEAEALIARWKKEGADYANIFDHGGEYKVTGVLAGEFIRPQSGTVMPR